MGESRVKILYLHRILSKDGMVVHLEELIDAFRNLGHEVILVGPASFTRSEFGHDPKLLTRIKELIPKKVYEIAECFYNVVAFLRLLLAYSRFHPDVVYERCNLYSFAGVLLRKLTQVPLILEVNAPLARERKNFGGLGFARFAAAGERWVWRNADVVLPVTAVLAAEIAKAGVATTRLVVTPNAIDPGKFDPACHSVAAREELGLSDKIVLGFVGFVRDWHGLHQIIEILARPDLPANTHLMIVGEGPALPELKSKANQLGIEDRVTFAGLIDRSKIAQTVAAFDIALIPKCVEYCSPLKLFEYMAAGKAIVAPDQWNIREILMSGTSALLFQPDSPRAMADGIVQLVRDAPLRQKLGREAQALITRRGYTWRANAERVSRLAAALLVERRKARLCCPRSDIDEATS
jgi:glycosyltransferase involved in cell wall biosynthesis